MAKQGDSKESEISLLSGASDTNFKFYQSETIKPDKKTTKNKVFSYSES